MHSGWMVRWLYCGGWDGGVQQGDEQRAGGRDRGPLKGSRLWSEWDRGQEGGRGALAAEAGWGWWWWWWGDSGGLHWFNATAGAAVKRGLPFFPRPVRRRNPASACQGQVTFLIYTLGLWTRTMHMHSSFVLCTYAHRQTHTCMHTASRQPLRQRDREVGAATKRVRENYETDFYPIGTIVSFWVLQINKFQVMCPNTHTQTHMQTTSLHQLSLQFEFQFVRGKIWMKMEDFLSRSSTSSCVFLTS